MVLEVDFPPDVRVENEIQLLDDLGISVDLACYTFGKTTIEKYRNSTVYKFHLSWLMYKFKALAMELPFYHIYWKKRINRVLDKGNYTILHIHDLPLARVGWKLRKKYRFTLITDYHENRPAIMPFYSYVRNFPGKYLISVKRWEQYQRRACIETDRLVVVTPEARQYYVDRYKIRTDKIFVLSNYVNVNQISNFKIDKEITSKYKDRNVFLYFGETGIRRGTLDILRVAKELKDTCPANVFTIIGSSAEQHLLENYKESENLQNVELLGYIPIEKAVSYMSIAYAGLCPFHRNDHHDTTYANKMFQYMYFGVPIIASNCIAQMKVIEDSNCGYTFKSGNIEEFAGVVKKITEDVDERNQLGQNGKQSVLSGYNWNNQKSVIKRLYDF